MGSVEIEDLVSGILQGDKGAFRELYQRYSYKVYKTAVTIIGDEKTAEDIMQEVFTTIYTKIHRLSHPAAFESWMYKILVNSCNIYFRKNKKSTILDDEGVMQLQDISSSAMPEKKALIDETNMVLDKCINKLSDKLKVCIVLFYFNNMSIREIAGIINCSEGTVKSRLSNAKKQLEKLLTLENVKEVGIYEYK